MDGTPTHSYSDRILSTLTIVVKRLSPGLSSEKRKIVEENGRSSFCIHLSGKSVFSTGLVCRPSDTDRFQPSPLSHHSLSQPE